MASYNVLKSDGTTLATVTDLTINSSAASIKFIGRNIVDYGQDIAENHVHIMENFANTTEPVTPVAGQLWWDTNIDVLKVFDGSTFSQTGLQNIVEDTTPQLGGNLDNNGFGISTDGSVVLSFASSGEEAENNIEIVHSQTASGPIIRSVGSDTDIDLNISAKGAGIVNLGSGGVKLNAPLDVNNQVITNATSISTGGEVVLSFTPGAEEGVNFVDIVTAELSQGPIIRSVGAASNIDLNISAKGTGIVNLGSGGVKFNAPLDFNGQTVTDVGSFITGDEVVLTFSQGSEEGVNWVDIVTAELSQGPVIRSVGAASNIDLVFDTKGTGDIDVSSNKIINLASPMSSEDAATKDYVDTEVAGVGVPVPAFRLDPGPAPVIGPGDATVVFSSGGPGQAVVFVPVGAFPLGTIITLKNGIGTTGTTILPAGAETIDGVAGLNAGLLAGPLAFTRLIGDGVSNWYVA